MKKLSLTIVLCLSVALSFGQKKAVSDAKREISSSNPNFEDARTSFKMLDDIVNSSFDYIKYFLLLFFLQFFLTYIPRLPQEE